MSEPRDTQIAKAHLEANGYVILRAKSYRQAQERFRVSEALRKAEEQYRRDTQRWGEERCDEWRRLADRLNRVCFAAASLGVPIEAINAALDGDAR